MITRARKKVHERLADLSHAPAVYRAKQLGRGSDDEATDGRNGLVVTNSFARSMEQRIQQREMEAKKGFQSALRQDIYKRPSARKEPKRYNDDVTFSYPGTNYRYGYHPKQDDRGNGDVNSTRRSQTSHGNRPVVVGRTKDGKVWLRRERARRPKPSRSRSQVEAQTETKEEQTPSRENMELMVQEGPDGKLTTVLKPKPVAPIRSLASLNASAAVLRKRLQEIENEYQRGVRRVVAEAKRKKRDAHNLLSKPTLASKATASVIASKEVAAGSRRVTNADDVYTVPLADDDEVDGGNNTDQAHILPEVRSRSPSPTRSRSQSPSRSRSASPTFGLPSSFNATGSVTGTGGVREVLAAAESQSQNESQNENHPSKVHTRGTAYRERLKQIEHEQARAMRSLDEWKEKAQREARRTLSNAVSRRRA